MELKITSTEIADNTNLNAETGQYDVSGVSVLVEFTLDNESFTLDFQTSTTSDYGAINSYLLAYDGTDDWDRLEDMIDDDVCFYNWLTEIKIKSDAQAIWNEYIDENYTRNIDHFGGMDANSCFNEMSKKE